MFAQLDENNELIDIPADPGPPPTPGQTQVPVKVWRKSASFQYVENGVTYTAPRDWFTAWDMPKKYSVHIFPLVENAIDPKVERAAGDPVYTLDVPNKKVIATTPTQALTLEQAKDVKLVEITRARDNELTEPVFVTFGQNELAFSNDTVPHTLMLDVMTAVNAGLPWPANFKWSSIRLTELVETPPGSDNWEEVETHPQIVATITQAQAVDIAQAMVLHSYGANKQFIELREDIENATTLAEIDAIVWI